MLNLALSPESQRLMRVPSGHWSWLESPTCAAYNMLVDHLFDVTHS